MKEAKEKPVAKITAHQLASYKETSQRESAVSEQLVNVGMQKQSLWRELFRAYKLDPSKDYYISTRTGEVFECWPEAK